MIAVLTQHLGRRFDRVLAMSRWIRSGQLTGFVELVCESHLRDEKRLRRHSHSSTIVVLSTGGGAGVTRNRLARLVWCLVVPMEIYLLRHYLTPL